MEVKDRLRIFSDLKAERTNYDDDWQIVADYVYTVKADFTKHDEDTSFTNQQLYDKTATMSLNVRASTLLSLLWDSGKFMYKPNTKYFKDKSDLNDWFQYCTDIARKEFYNAEADRILDESEKDEAAFGLSYVFLDGSNDRLNLKLFQVKECYINETKGDKIDTLYRNYCITVKQCVDTFGIENVSDSVKSAYESKKYNDKVEMLHIIQPRMMRNVTKQGVEDMPYESVYIDIKANKEIKKQGVQKGFEYFPVYISREGKRNGEKYAYSPTMMAIEEVSQINKVREDQILIMNRFADPAIGYDSTALESNVLNTSPGSSTSFRMNGRAGLPIFDMVQTKGDPTAVENLIVRLQETINKYYGIDVLLDFNTQNQMTLGEAQIRAQIRQQTLGATIMKKRSEKYRPIVERAFDILFKQGKFGYIPGDERIQIEEDLGLKPMVIPEEVVNLINAGIEPMELIEVQFYTQFEYEKELLKNNSIIQVWNNAGLIAQLTQRPEVFDNLDEDKTIKELGTSSFNIDIFRDNKEIDAIRGARADNAAQQQQLATMQQGATIAKDLGVNVSNNKQQ
jgi:hypothetical protein